MTIFVLRWLQYVVGQVANHWPVFAAVLASLVVLVAVGYVLALLERD